MPRPRTISDTQILEGAAHVIAQRPADWTLRDVGNFVGLNAGTLIQRFRSKANLERKLLADLNKHDGHTRHRDMIGELAGISCNGDRHRFGLLAFRLVAAHSRNQRTRKLAGAES